MAAILPPHRKLNEAVSLRCALGIRFRDPATNRIVRSGLRVQASPVNASVGAEPVTAAVNRSGVWLFRGLPGLQTFELGTEDQEEASSPPEPPRFNIKVQDEECRFLPCTFVATASSTGPMEFITPISPPLDGKDVPLFSSPERVRPPGTAVIRTHFVVRPQNKPYEPAPWALLEAATTVRNRPIRVLGVANQNGDLAIMFPWPELVGMVISASPPTGLGTDTPGWDFNVSAWHDFNLDADNFADLNAIFARLSRQPDALETSDSPPMPFTSATLQYGRELIIPQRFEASPPSSDVELDSAPRVLIITPAGSPP